LAQTHHPVSTTETPNADREAIALLQSSGILNPNVTLAKIMEVAATLAKSSGVTERLTAVFIHPDFIFKSQI
jgi:hypothetical protein